VSNLNSIDTDIYKVKLVDPNLGHPLILNIDTERSTENFQTELQFISNITDSKQIYRILKDNIELLPILDYRLELKKLLEKRREEELKRKELEKKKGFWARWKEKRAKKKREKKKRKALKGKEEARKLEVDEIDERLRKLKPRPFRGDAVVPFIMDVKQVSCVSISSLNFLNDFTSSQDYLLKYNVFRGLNYFYKISIEFSLTDQIKQFLKERTFVMFDIVNRTDPSKIRKNSHSLVISRQEWKDFSFVHATDLHLAQRNDSIYEIVKKWTSSSIKKEADKFFEKAKKKLKLGRKRKKDKQETLDGLKTPLRKRLLNPNNQFRRFIKLMNRRVLQNDLDFVVLTGDLIDFTVLSSLSKQLRKVVNFRYKYSNWQIFNNIVLNSPSEKKYTGVDKGEELLCPLFTVLGNHDYRPYHYDITWAGMYKKIGLNASEAVALNDIFSASPITAITKSPLALRGYLSDVSSSLDSSIMLGNNLFIFLNSGSDSFKNLKDLIMGHPAVTGLSHKQIKYLENLINHKIKDNTNTFLFLHGPPINTSKKRFLIKWLEKKESSDLRTKLEDFKESLLKKMGMKESKGRVDGKFNVKFGGISTNWEKLINFCKDYCVLTLAGHTHLLKEYRLGDPESKTKVFKTIPFSLKKLENPAAIYYDNYSEIFTTAEDIEKFKPFIVQTSALGLGGYKNPETVGAYRDVVIKEGKLSSFKVHYINQ
jgi:Icc-related predicted phosphoesterase